MTKRHVRRIEFGIRTYFALISSTNYNRNRSSWRYRVVSYHRVLAAIDVAAEICLGLDKSEEIQDRSSTITYLQNACTIQLVRIRLPHLFHVVSALRFLNAVIKHCSKLELANWRIAVQIFQPSSTKYRSGVVGRNSAPIRRYRSRLGTAVAKKPARTIDFLSELSRASGLLRMFCLLYFINMLLFDIPTINHVDKRVEFQRTHKIRLVESEATLVLDVSVGFTENTLRRKMATTIITGQLTGHVRSDGREFDGGLPTERLPRFGILFQRTDQGYRNFTKIHRFAYTMINEPVPFCKPLKRSGCPMSQCKIHRVYQLANREEENQEPNPNSSSYLSLFLLCFYFVISYPLPAARSKTRKIPSYREDLVDESTFGYRHPSPPEASTVSWLDHGPTKAADYLLAARSKIRKIPSYREDLVDGPTFGYRHPSPPEASTVSWLDHGPTKAADYLLGVGSDGPR
ncbi:hypothetical protein CLF_109929 [Clonorchis sinensis]|uniref:Uncharacterized protein n=1 Tax=Clonorchis sinensis TaxID=79923 RepID=G7YJZ3_CLOSI|nr:hypothetical protein CLF_109929 [Clonorchis sinensis]